MDIDNIKQERERVIQVSYREEIVKDILAELDRVMDK